jgi:hypothetical protein
MRIVINTPLKSQKTEDFSEQFACYGHRKKRKFIAHLPSSFEFVKKNTYLPHSRAKQIARTLRVRRRFVKCRMPKKRTKAQSHCTQKRTEKQEKKIAV